MLTTICVSSQYSGAMPITDIQSQTIVEDLTLVFSRLGFPRELQTDLGTSFTSNLTPAFPRKFDVKISQSSVEHPERYLIERWHPSVKRPLKVLCTENETNWEANLPYALLALKTMTHESTGFSPAELVHGKNLRTSETFYEKWIGEEHDLELELTVENMVVARDKIKIW